MAALPDDNLNYPVFIQTDFGVGSGFVLNTGNAVYLVTAKHVVERNGALEKGTKIRFSAYFDRFRLKLRGQIDVDTILGNNAYAPHPVADVCVFILMIVIDGGKRGKHVVGVSIDADGGTSLTGAAISSAKKLSDVGISNDVFAFGYPVSVGSINQLEPEKPLLRKGIVAGINTANNSIIIDLPAYPGNSGGLVLESDSKGFEINYHPIGIVTQLVPFYETVKSVQFGYSNTNIENSGYAIVEPMDRVIELVDQIEATMFPSTPTK